MKTVSFLWRTPKTPRGVEPLPKPNYTGVDFDTGWARSRLSRVARFLALEGPLRAAVMLFAAPHRKGLENFKNINRPMIFVANHHSHADTPVLLVSLPTKWRRKTIIAAAADYFFRGRFISVVSALFIGATPVERTRVERSSADRLSDLIAEGWSLLIYPEGGRSPDGWGQPFRGGAAYLSKRCNAPVMPIYVSGTNHVLRKGSVFPKLGATTVTFGKPLYPSTQERASKMAIRIEEAVNTLADELQTDWYSARQRAHAHKTPTLTGPDISTWRRIWAKNGTFSSRKQSKRSWPPL